MEKLWKINCAIFVMLVIDVKMGDGSLDGFYALHFHLTSSCGAVGGKLKGEIYGMDLKCCEPITKQSCRSENTFIDFRVN